MENSTVDMTLTIQLIKKYKKIKKMLCEIPMENDSKANKGRALVLYNEYFAPKKEKNKKMSTIKTAIMHCIHTGMINFDFPLITDYLEKKAVKYISKMEEKLTGSDINLYKMSCIMEDSFYHYYTFDGLHFFSREEDKKKALRKHLEYQIRTAKSFLKGKSFVYRGKIYISPYYI